MPELSRFYGIIITMYFNDTNQHHKPHIHAYYGDYEAVIAIDGELLAGSIPSKQYRMINGWQYMKQNFLRRGITLFKISISTKLAHCRRSLCLN